MVTFAYLDTSAAMKLLVEESESAALVEAITADPERRLLASWLLHTELHCASGRHPTALDVSSIGQVLDAVDLVELTRGDMLVAGTLAPLRSHDALHLATALRLGVAEFFTCDHELADAASRAGLRVVAPR